MRKSISVAIIAIIFSIITQNCARVERVEKIENPSEDFVKIGDIMFMTQVNDVYLNADDYLGKTIKLEGIFTKEQYDERDDPYCFVIRYGPGCCGYDGNVGFEVKWNIDKPYPDVNDWVEASGVLQYYEENYAKYLYLDLASLDVLDKRGLEYVIR